MPLVPCHFDLPISSYGLWLKVPFCWLLKMTYNVEIDNFLWEHFLVLKCEEELLEMSFSSKWALDGIFLIIHVEVMPWSSYSWLFQLSKYGNFCILRLFWAKLWESWSSIDQMMFVASKWYVNQKFELLTAKWPFCPYSWL